MMAREELASMGAGVGDSTAMMADFVAGGAIGPEAR